MPAGLSAMWLGVGVIVVGVIVVGFAAKWTDRTFGLVQVLNPDLFEWLGTWVMRLGVAVAAAGAVLWTAEALT